MRPLRRIIAIVFAAVLLGLVFGRPAPAEADIAPAPCSGNVCTGSIVVGGQTVQYAYTQHIRPSGTLKVRLNGGLYNTGQLISYIVHDLPAFSSWGKYNNPSGSPLPVYLPTEDINPGHTAYERKDANGCASCVVDQVMTMTYAALSAGAYSFDLTIVQNGTTGGQLNLPFYVDAGAPNTDESFAWNAIPGMTAPCADAFDNDLSYAADCADLNCAGQVGRVGDGALCQLPETTCYDNFDNDADGLLDCLDSSCDGLTGRQSPAALCQFGNEKGAASCTDTFDNDGDGLSDCLDNATAPGGGPASDACWKQGAYGCPATEISCSNGLDDDKDMSYSSAYDAQPLTGVDCKDYDCAGNLACPANESKTAAGDDAEAQCFNGIDDDLDTAVDCADIDCVGVINPGDSSQACYEKEFDLAVGYQFCANTFDDDGDAPIDCSDLDCKRSFGNCGPCPAREDFTFDSCQDASDNDSDQGTEGLDCADPDCVGDYGSFGYAAKCAAAESGSACADRFDNDGDGSVDCQDSGCVGAAGPDGQTCQASETSCGDNLDNDGDGLSDCVDTQCFGLGACAAKTWTNSACRLVPEFSGYSAFTSSSPTVTARAHLSSHANPGADPAKVQIKGTASYSSVSIIIGSNADPAKYYPYASATCTLSGAGAAQMSFIAVEGHAIQIINNAGQTIVNFDVTLDCATPSSPATQRTYPISVSMLKTPGDVPEYGDVDFSTTLYEHAAPSVAEIEFAGGGALALPYNAARSLRVVPNDPGAGLDTSGICQCTLRVVGPGTTYDSADGNCITPALAFVSDAAMNFDASAQDGAANVSSFQAATAVSVNVTPAVTTILDIRPTGASKPFFKNGRMSLELLDAEFYTGTTDIFNATCDVLIRDAGGAILGGPGPTTTIPGQTFATNRIKCAGTVDLSSLPVGMSDGEYFVTVRVHDDDNDYLESNRQVLMMCNSVPGPGDVEGACSKADFDDDGAPEGLYTQMYSSSKRSCDNCLGLANDQTDKNANGIGDSCEPKEPYGRCEIDTDLVCSCTSDPLVSCESGGIRCPGPSIADIPGQPAGTKKDPQACKDAWGVCKIGGSVCFDDVECNFCADNVTGCRIDADCVAAGVAGPCDGGQGRCADTVTHCRRNADCAAASVAGPCTGGNGLCAGDNNTACIRDTDCDDAGVVGPCVGANICENMLTPWLETKYGNLFSKKKISAPETPPAGRFNATYCITAKDQITNFQSEACLPATGETDPQTQFERPKADNAYGTVLGRIDVNGLVSGRYGTVVPLQADMSNVTYPLNGKVYLLENSDLTVAVPQTILNGGPSSRGNGTFVIKGGNLIINANVEYGATPVNALKELASVGWIVLDTDVGDPAYGTKGNVYFGANVTLASGAFFAGGQNGVYTVWPDTAISSSPLRVYGLMVSRAFHLRRGYKSSNEGSEQFIYDGRSIANPPPGFADVSKNLPVFRDSAP